MTGGATEPASAVVFAYHSVGVRCLEALLALGVRVELVVTHEDQAAENVWFDSVAETAAEYGTDVITPAEPNVREIVEQVRAHRPDFVFSFYYRHLLGDELLDVPARGAFNLHGSLLPKYRGRVPVNWAIIHGEDITGVSLHRMVSRPDAGHLVAQKSVAVLRNDTALDVFRKLICAAESLILEAVPSLVDGTAVETPLDLAQGSYFSGRRPQDGEIDWSRPAWDVHNLIRAVAPPWPGAFFHSGNHRIDVTGSRFQALPSRNERPCIYFQDGAFWADCADGLRIRLAGLLVDQRSIDGAEFAGLFGERLELGGADQPKGR